MTIHRGYFFDNIRYYLFKSFTQEQVDGLNTFLDWYDQDMPPMPERYHIDDRCLAYILATSYHETAFTMQPVTEYGSQSYLQSKSYYPWIGRGHVQLTWEENYQKQDDKLNLKGALMKNPDLALDPIISMQVITLGMYDGDFTGKKLGNFFTAEDTNFYDARTIVNGHDAASTIAGYAEKFLNALSHM